MRIDHLQYLLEIDKYHSISAAAQQLYLGQTTLSSIVRSVEQELGFPIFYRTHNGVQTTPEGEEALALIWDMSCRFNEIKRLNENRAISNQPIPIVLSPTMNSVLALPVNDAFLREEPYGNLEFHAVSGEEVGTMMIKNDANIGVTYYTEKDYADYCAIASRYQINVERVFTDHLYLLVSKQHPLAERDSIACSELENLTIALLSYFVSCDSSLAYSKSFGQNNRYITLQNIALIKQAVLTGNTAAILSGLSIQYNQSEDNEQMKAIILTGTQEKNQMDVCLIHRTDHNLQYQEKVVLQCIKDYFGALQAPPFSPEAALAEVAEQ